MKKAYYELNKAYKHDGVEYYIESITDTLINFKGVFSNHELAIPVATQETFKPENASKGFEIVRLSK